MIDPDVGSLYASRLSEVTLRVVGDSVGTADFLFLHIVTLWAGALGHSRDGVFEALLVLHAELLQTRLWKSRTRLHK